MSTKYRIRLATASDHEKVQSLFIHSVANEKKVLHPSHIKPSFVHDFVHKVIANGHMVIVENQAQELELIGHVHHYNTPANAEKCLKELVFYSRTEGINEQRETELVNWLFEEIEKKHTDVFNVELTTPVSNLESLILYQQRGIQVEGNHKGRLKKGKNKGRSVLPLSWLNPSFN